ncbi:squalene synthase HpnC [Massilia sp. YIM B02443]|uniref:squalene synthase HpnC n=1 Tax=Massilia sp. YIM B02443 TaxID=3050127 RepID=UPI0025B6F8AD|nr:squalene synthase HpnC [Massilia sp. YIM B02443]MDN4038599.1 squalene synthase HpnC [Massilia sp. YIM B02443]
MAIDHYENFPVASILLPRRLVPAVEAIYAFARSADDLADEGDATPQQRLDALQAYERQLDLIAAGQQPADPMFARLAAVVAQYRLSLQPMRDLLSAFKQDVATHRYADYAGLLDYCRRSADPVGRLMLALYGADDAHNLRESDAICSALQLTNFWQDVAIDFTKGRVYIPQEDLARFNVSESALRAGTVDAPFQALMRFEVERARALMLSGAPLVKRLPGRIGMELRMIVQGGLRILEKLDGAGYDVFRRRPVLAWHDWLVVGWRALRM